MCQALFGPLHRVRSMASRRWRLVVACVTGLLLAGGAIVAVAGQAQAGQVTTVAALPASWYESAPYYLTLDSDAPDLGQVMAATGQKAFDMAFILADGSSCAPSWDGTDPVSSDTQVASVISEVRSDGGDVIVSAGGYNGTKLGQVCGSAAATAAAYQQVITTYGLHAFDLDLEEPEIEDSSAIANELGAAQILQQEDSGLFVSITIPSTTTGANFFGQQLLDEAQTLGFTPDDYTIMPFDGGFSGGSSQVTALQDFNGQLMSTFGWSSAQAYAHEGFSGMNGQTNAGEFFYQSDFQTVLSFAESSGMGRFTFWSVNRDRECDPVDNNDVLSSDCSGVAQNPWDFTAFTVAFANNTSPSGTPAPTPTPTTTHAPITTQKSTTTQAPSAGPTPTSAPNTTPATAPGGCTASAWVSDMVYISGEVVTYGSDQWTANQWNADELPGGSSGAWNDDGPCAPASDPGSAPSGCTASAWVSDTAYVSGDVASYAGDQWTANQWNYGEVPGGASGAWNNGGPC
jgi:chitinase